MMHITCKGSDDCYYKFEDSGVKLSLLLVFFFLLQSLNYQVIHKKEHYRINRWLRKNDMSLMFYDSLLLVTKTKQTYSYLLQEKRHSMADDWKSLEYRFVRTFWSGQIQGSNYAFIINLFLVSFPLSNMSFPFLLLLFFLCEAASLLSRLSFYDTWQIQGHILHNNYDRSPRNQPHLPIVVDKIMQVTCSFLRNNCQVCPN